MNRNGKNKKQVVRLNESQLRKIVSESVKTVLKEHKRLVREFGFDRMRDDIVGMDLQDAIARLESEGWNWNPRNEKRNGDTLETVLTPSKSMDTGRYYSVTLFITSKPDNETQSFRVETACETWN